MKTRAVLEREASRHPECVVRFVDGISSVFCQWTALELAIHNQWGGPGQGPEQVAALVEEVKSLFLGPEIIYKDDISLVLEDFMETYFNTLLEDGSSEEIGELFCNMWRKCSTGDFSVVDEVRRKEAQRPQVAQMSKGLDASGDILEGDDDDSECVSNTVFRQAVAHQMERIREEDAEDDVAKESAEEVGATEMSVVDADGFMLVQTGKSKKSKKVNH